MSKPPRILETLTVKVPADEVVFSQRAHLASAGSYMAHLPTLIVGGSEDLEQKGNPPERSFPNTHYLFAPTSRRRISGVDPRKTGGNAQPSDVQERLGRCGRVGLQVVGDLHQYAAETFAATLAIGQKLFKKEKGSLHPTLTREMALHHLSSVYLQAMLAVTDEVGAEIMDRIVSQSRIATLGAEERRRIDQVSELYLRCVREMFQKKERVYDEKGVKPFGIGAADPIR